mmetsp:Transcript_47453/g.76130  ORF Transcript_47453/g.76130 Transcript_47453/m.76130 type:complete len:219 (+) Transcript_47453:834-1490(+)
MLVHLINLMPRSMSMFFVFVACLFMLRLIVLSASPRCSATRFPSTTANTSSQGWKLCVFLIVVLRIIIVRTVHIGIVVLRSIIARHLRHLLSLSASLSSRRWLLAVHRSVDVLLHHLVVILWWILVLSRLLHRSFAALQQVQFLLHGIQTLSNHQLCIIHLLFGSNDDEFLIVFILTLWLVDKRLIESTARRWQHVAILIQLAIAIAIATVFAFSRRT